MASSEFVYVPAKRSDHAAIRALAPCANLVQFGREEYARVVSPRRPDAAKRLSSEYGEAIRIAVQTVVDAFVFERWVDGKRVRRLQFGCDGPEERTWEAVEGTPEPWEAEVFFPEEDLAFELELVDEELRLESRGKGARARATLQARAETRREELREVWRERRIEIGSHTPAVSTPWDAIDIGAWYGLSNEQPRPPAPRAKTPAPKAKPASKEAPPAKAKKRAPKPKKQK